MFCHIALYDYYIGSKYLYYIGRKYFFGKHYIPTILTQNNTPNKN